MGVVRVLMRIRGGGENLTFITDIHIHFVRVLKEMFVPTHLTPNIYDFYFISQYRLLKRDSLVT